MKLENSLKLEECRAGFYKGDTLLLASEYKVFVFVFVWVLA